MMEIASGPSEQRDAQLLEETRMLERNVEDLSGIKPKVAIVVGDAVSRRLIEAASVHLELVPHELTFGQLETMQVGEFELIVADEKDARAIRATLQQREKQVEGVNPAVIAVRTRGTAAPVWDR